MRAFLALLFLAPLALGDRTVDRDGKILKGSAEVSREERLVRVGRKKLPLDQVYLVERDDGTLVYAPDLHARLRGYEYLANEHVRKAYVKLVRESLQVSDFGLARELLEKAEAAGLSTKEAGKLKLRVEREEKKSKKGRVRSERLRKKADTVDAYHGEFLAQRARRALEDGTEGARLLRAALRRAPESKLANELLENLAPEEFPVGDARVWLDWHLDLERSEATVSKTLPLLLETACASWRDDLHGVKAEPILMVTPVKDSHTVGRCMAYGKLTCEVLSALFHAEKPVPPSRDQMTVFLFESRKEYMTTSGTGKRIGDPSFLEWSAGHYSPSEGISRLFWRKDRDAERRIVGTFVHELTHHWLEERNPRVAASPVYMVQPGFWIVEGFATFMEEGIYDPETGKWDLFNPRCRSLDMLQGIAARKLIPWKTFFAMRPDHFHALPGDVTVRVVGRWHLYPQPLDPRRLFYEQAAAACHYLYHAEGGKRRQQLLDYVVSYYGAEARRLSPKKAFGLDGDELGRRILNFARSVSKGWRP